MLNPKYFWPLKFFYPKKMLISPKMLTLKSVDPLKIPQNCWPVKFIDNPKMLTLFTVLLDWLYILRLVFLAGCMGGSNSFRQICCTESSTFRITRMEVSVQIDPPCSLTCIYVVLRAPFLGIGYVSNWCKIFLHSALMQSVCTSCSLFGMDQRELWGRI